MHESSEGSAHSVMELSGSCKHTMSPERRGGPAEGPAPRTSVDCSAEKALFKKHNIKLMDMTMVTNQTSKQSKICMRQGERSKLQLTS